MAMGETIKNNKNQTLTINIQPGRKKRRNNNIEGNNGNNNDDNRP